MIFLTYFGQFFFFKQISDICLSFWCNTECSETSHFCFINWKCVLPTEQTSLCLPLIKSKFNVPILFFKGFLTSPQLQCLWCVNLWSSFKFRDSQLLPCGHFTTTDTLNLGPKLQGIIFRKQPLLLEYFRHFFSQGKFYCLALFIMDKLANKLAVMLSCISKS